MKPTEYCRFCRGKISPSETYEDAPVEISARECSALGQASWFFYAHWKCWKRILDTRYSGGKGCPQ